MHCRAVYREADNLGRLLCAIHPGLKLCDDQGRSYYSCCGMECEARQKGQIHAIESSGCLVMDHMQSVYANEPTTTTTTSTPPVQQYKMDTHSVSLRLETLCRFAVTVVPSAMFRSGAATQPLSQCVVYESSGSSSSSPLIMPPSLKSLVDVDTTRIHCTLRAPTQARENHNSLITYHDPYSDSAMLSLDSPLLDYEEHYNARKRRGAVDPPYAVDVLLTDIMKSIHADIDAPTDDAGDRGATSSRRPVQQESWASYGTINDKKTVLTGGGALGSASQNRDEKRLFNATSFMVILRIGDKLNINQRFSRLK